MTRFSTSAVLDEAVELVSRRVAGPAGLLILTLLPLRFLEAWLANRLSQLGDNATDYVGYLTSLSVLVSLGLLPALWGRAVYARSCALALSSGPESLARIPWRQRLRLRPAAFLSYVYAAAVFELLFVAVGWTLVALPVLAMLSGVAAAISHLDEEEDRPGLLASLGRVLRHTRPLGVLMGLAAVFALAVPVVFLNLFVLFQIVVWLMSGTTGIDSAWWSTALSFKNLQFVFLALAGALLVLEPFWLAALVATVRRARARQSGEDLAAWFKALRRGSSLPLMTLLAPLMTLLALLSTALLPAPAAAEVLPVAVYQQRLAGIDARIRAGDWVGARAGAKDLLDDRIAYGDERLEPDLSILRPLADARDADVADIARAAAPRLSRLAAGLAQVTPAAAAAQGDAKLLEEIRAREAAAALPMGGRLPQRRTNLLEAIEEIVAPFLEWLEDLWNRFLKWLAGLFGDDSEEEAGAFDLPGTVVVVVVLLALFATWLAWRAVRNRRRGEAPVTAEAVPPPPAADDDPLSRVSSEWERYAAELAAAGRFREAIRAWYHAVLVTLFRGGVLYHRKGRTNWEYVSMLAPGHAWRPRFIELTRHFEREWYGRDQSSPEALREAEDLARGLLGSLREAA